MLEINQIDRCSLFIDQVVLLRACAIDPLVWGCTERELGAEFAARSRPRVVSGVDRLEWRIFVGQ